MSGSRADAGRLVVVDDEEVIRDLLVDVLSEEPWAIEACATGAEALAAMGRGFDVLLTDKNLPDVSGMELLRRARDFQPDAEVILLTGYASLDTALQAIELEAFDYLVKPPRDIYEVRRKVRAAFEKQQMARENRRLVSELTERNAALEATLAELEATQAELVQSEKLAGIGTLAAGVAHEISSPLFGVMGLAEAILDEDDPEVVRSHAREIVEYSRTIKDIVVELSGYSRSAEREYVTTLELARVVEDAVRLVQRSAGVDPETFRLDLDPGLWVHARTSEIQQVFVNLVKNAVEAMREAGVDGRVTVAAGRDGPFVWATVRDEGPGVPEEARAQIFDPFFTTKAPGQGTGLGLNIVYRLVAKYRGAVSVESPPGGGAVFRVRLPAGDPETG